MDLAAALRSHTPLMRGLIGLYAASGTLHLVRPEIFEGIVPRQLSARRELVLLSGVAEIACAVGLLDDRTRRFSGAFSAALLIAVLPANVEMARQANRAAKRSGAAWRCQALRIGTLVRIPAQVPLVMASLDVARGRA